MSQCLQYAVAFADDDENSYIRPQQKPVPELKLIEFKAETYNYLLGSILPGINWVYAKLSYGFHDPN